MGGCSASGRCGQVLVACLVVSLLLCCGCPLVPATSDPNDPLDSNSSIDTGDNSSLRTATALTLNSTGQLSFTGVIDSRNDIDVYSLGTLSRGDRIYVDVQRLNGDLDALAAIFDSREYLIAWNDDRTPDGSVLDPQLDFTLAGDTDIYYLAIIAYPGDASYGQYLVEIQITRAAGAPTPYQQIVYLNWAGGDRVVVRNVGVYNLPPFSAIDVGFSSSRTAALKQRVQEVVEQRYAEYDLLVLNSDDDPVPSVAYSTVYFGGADYQAFAISEQIDAYNEDHGDDAIIFTQSFQGAFAQPPTFEEMAQALGNTVAHEVGHLLGLVHTADCDDLMDTTCFNDRLLSPQEFSTAPLDTSVFPFGYQSATELLSWVLGLAD